MTSRLLQGLVEGDSVAEVVELLDESVSLSVGVRAAGEVVAADVVVVAGGGEQVPADHQDGVTDCEGCLLLSDASGQAPELRGQVGIASVGAAQAPWVRMSRSQTSPLVTFRGPG